MRAIVILSVCWGLFTDFAGAQSQAQPFPSLLSVDAAGAQAKENTGQDPTEPLARVDLRGRYEEGPGGKSRATLIPRLDVPFILAPGWQIATRFDFPVVADDSAGGTSRAGLSDVLSQFLLEHEIDSRSAWALGARIVSPTASDDQLGGGKWVVSPTGAYRVSLPEIGQGSFVAPLVRYQTSMAGAADRSDVSRLQLGPIFNVNLPGLWFVTLNSSADTTYDLMTGKWFVPLDVTVGKKIGRRWIVSVEAEQALVRDLPLYDFKLEARVGFFF